MDAELLGPPPAAATMTELLEPLSSLLEPVEFTAGTIIFREGDPTDSFFVVEAGDVRLEVHSDEIDTDATLAFVTAGAILGEIGILTGASRSATAIAHTDVAARRMSRGEIERLYRDRPVDGLTIARVLGEAAAWRVRSVNAQQEQHLFVDHGDPVVDAMVARAGAAQHAFEDWEEDRVDLVLADIASAIADAAPDLAAATIAETGIGRVEDKEEKIVFGSLGVYATLRGTAGN